MSNEISNRGVTIETPSKPKKCGLDEAIEDIRAGRVYKAESTGIPGLIVTYSEIL